MIRAIRLLKFFALPCLRYRKFEDTSLSVHIYLKVIEGNVFNKMRQEAEPFYFLFFYFLIKSFSIEKEKHKQTKFLSTTASKLIKLEGMAGGLR